MRTFLFQEVANSILQQIHQLAQCRMFTLDEYLAGNWGRFSYVGLQASQEQHFSVVAVREACLDLL